jgi:post-segregation antitoxin (ccd killing protein)
MRKTLEETSRDLFRGIAEKIGHGKFALVIASHGMLIAIDDGPTFGPCQTLDELLDAAKAADVEVLRMRLRAEAAEIRRYADDLWNRDKKERATADHRLAARLTEAADAPDPRAALLAMGLRR